MSRKIFTVIAVVLLMVSIAWAGGSLVTVDPGTTVNTIWSGANGTFTLNGTMGNGAITNVWNGSVGTFSGNALLGTSTGTYSVDNTTSNINAGFAGVGYAQFNLTRTLSYVSSYGPAGQYVYGDIFSNTTGQLGVTNITTNYAKMFVYNTQLGATGTFQIDHGITDGVNGAGLTSSGIGSSQVSAGMYSSAGGALGGSPLAFTFGRGGGCHTDASVIATGSGVFTESAGASNGLNIYTSSTIWATHHSGDPGNATLPIPGNGTPGSANYFLQIGYTGNFTLPNFSLSGN